MNCEYTAKAVSGVNQLTVQEFEDSKLSSERVPPVR